MHLLDGSIAGGAQRWRQAPKPPVPPARRNHGCNSGACVLCKHNPAKRCTGNFAHKYWVGDKLLAKCEGAILVELINADTGERCDSVAGMRIEARPLWSAP